MKKELVSQGRCQTTWPREATTFDFRMVNRYDRRNPTAYNRYDRSTKTENPTSCNRCPRARLNEVELKEESDSLSTRKTKKKLTGTVKLIGVMKTTAGSYPPAAGQRVEAADKAVDEAFCQFDCGSILRGRANGTMIAKRAFSSSFQLSVKLKTKTFT